MRSVAFAANRAGISFLGGKDSSAMESYCVIDSGPGVMIAGFADDWPAVVIDSGPGVMIAVFANDWIPRYCFSNYVGVFMS